jgi:hypothetical protein
MKTLGMDVLIYMKIQQSRTISGKRIKSIVLTARSIAFRIRNASGSAHPQSFTAMKLTGHFP